MCDCIWQELPNQTGEVRGSVLVTECEPCKVRREEQAAAYAEEHKYDHFDFMLLEGRMIQVIERWDELSLKGVPYAMNRLLTYPDKKVNCFARFKAYLGRRVTDETLTQAESDIIYGLFQEQGINLEEITV